MNIGDILTLAPQIIPLMPRIQKAIATVQRLEADADVKDALALGNEIAQIIEKSGIKS
jgi:hypothetical protein